MPPFFAEECAKVREKYEQLYYRFHLLKHEIRSQVVLKVIGNNKVYENLVQMLRHAQLVYRNRKDMQQLFQFDKLQKTARKKKKNSTTAEAKSAVLSFLNKVAGMF